MNYKQEIIELINKIPETGNQPKIGIGITEYNRYSLFSKSYQEITKRLPPNSKLVVVDDCSTKPFPESTFRFETNVGISKAKNKCLELLDDCDYIFLFDSDTYPIVDNWWQPYIDSGEPHLMYIFTNFASGKKPDAITEIYRNDKIVAYTQTRGCVLFYKADVIKQVGGMDTIFGRWGYEHQNLSDRIFMAGFTSFRYMDVVNSKGLFYSDDEVNNNSNSSVMGRERAELASKNKAIYDKLIYSKETRPYKAKENIFLTCYFTGVNDTQGREWKPIIEPLLPLIKSLKETRLVVLHDCLQDPEIENVDFVKVSTSINPYFQRWISYRKFLMENIDKYKNVFCIDATDVEILKEPDWQNLGDNLFVGDEPEILNCEWMMKKHPVPILTTFFAQNKDKQLLNAGVCGGSVETVLEFMRALIDMYQLNRGVLGVTDMGVFNYIARQNFQHKLRHGREVTTTFKAYENNNYSWIKHK